nr:MULTISPECIES: gliding motility lipoprotein GldB [Litoribacter]
MISIFASCGKTADECTLSDKILNVPLDFQVERLEKQFFNIQNRQELSTFLDQHPDFTYEFLQEEAYSNREELEEELMFIIEDTLMQELNSEVLKHFEDFDQIEQDLENAFKYIKYYYPDFQAPKVYTFVSGFSADFYLGDDIIVIGLDYFLPADHQFQPDELPQYISNRYQKDYLVPTLITAMSARYNKTNMRDNTLLAEMIFYGKSYHFTKAIMPCTPDSLILGYSQDQIVASYANEGLIWSHFIENELLFETNPFEIRKYTGEAPATDEISPDAPGRIGRWVGWNIVDDYVDKNNVSLPELMEESRSEHIFRQSGYKPRR